MKKIKTILAILPALLFSCAGDDVEKYIRCASGKDHLAVRL